jgi:dihydroorotate dehydrogenase (NAD+) catalytic subunit
MEKKTKADISIRIGAVSFKNPVFLASGICGYGEEYSPLLAIEKLGGVVTKTITPLPRMGNPPPRIHELPTGALNSIGLENVGLETYITEKLPRLKDQSVDVVVSVAAEHAEDFERIANKFAPLDGYKGLELNLSCPNVEGRALDHGRDPEFVERITRIVKTRIPNKALLVKITPNVTDIGVVARAAEAGGADGISAVNTVVGVDFNLDTGKPIFYRGSGGYSGPGILPIALQKVWEIAKTVSIPVVGIGGIGSVDDARKFFIAGATAVQVGTALWQDPELPDRIISAFEAHPKWMRKGPFKT